jgi:hypothetical protein
MFYGGGLLAVLINREKIVPVFFVEMNFNAVINPEIKIKQLIQVPAEAVLLDRSHNTQQSCIFKKLTQHGFIVNTQFHLLLI